MESSKKFYVYTYVRTDGTPYYVGKGTGKRVRAPHGSVHVPKDRSRIIMCAENMTEPDALQLEMLLIAKYGRKDLKAGVLRNLTDGGDGVTGRIRPEEERQRISVAHKGRVFSDETRAKISAAKQGVIPHKATQAAAIANTGRTWTDEHRHKRIAGMKGRKRSAEACARMSVARKGRKLSDEHKQKLRTAGIGRKHTAESVHKMRESQRKRREREAQEA